MMASATSKPIAPFVRLFLYYVVLVALGVLIRQVWPDVYAMFSKSIAEGAGIGPALFGDVPAEPTGPLTDPLPAISTALVIVGALVVMLPVAWVYMLTKQREGYDRSVVQTLIALPTAICGVVVIVQNSFALAFALAGGCPGRQLFMSGEGDGESGIFVFGMITGAAFAHNFALASSPKGNGPHGMAAVVVCLIICFYIGFTNLKRVSG